MKTISPIAWVRAGLLALAALVFTSAPAWADKYASIVINMDTGQVLHDRNGDAPRHPASLTKVMTLYLVFDALDSGKLKLSDRMTVSKAASRAQPSKLGLKAGSTIKVEDAIRALVTKSANDVAIVIAEKLGGTESKFVVQMNAKAKQLGMLDTTFRNASGLPDRKQVTTARDMAKLGEAIFMDHRDRYKYFSLASFTWNNRKHMNHNELLKSVDGVDGIKTGFTNASGYNLMASAERDGHRIMAVMLGGTTGKSRDRHVADLIEAAFLEIGGVAPTDDDLRVRIAFGDRGNVSADDLAMAQLRKLQGEPDAALVSARDPALLADFDAAGAFDGDTTEEDETGFDLIAQGDSEAGQPDLDPIGDLIQASPGLLDVDPIASTPVPAAIPPAEIGILVTSEVPAGATPSTTALDQLALPVVQP
ncbi:MAG: D-alanyl-D-alanine carboxypeptidase family protein [Hyphomonadaceae bacterium]